MHQTLFTSFIREESTKQSTFGLEIDYYIKGSFRSDKELVRINAQLISTNHRQLVWADRFEGTTDQILDIQDDLLKQVVSSLQQQLNYDLLSQIREKPKIKLKAYECWLYGMEEVRKGSLESDIKAREYFQQAIEEEPHFSLAYSGMSLTYFNEWSCQLWERWEVSQGEAFDWANKAMELDERNYVASLVLGRVLMYDEAYETAEHYLRKSLALNPNDADNIMEIASCLTFLGYADEALELYERAKKINPAGSESYYPTAAFILFELGAYEQARELAAKTHQLPWVDTPAYFAAIHYHLGDLEKAESYWRLFLKTFAKKINDGKPCEPAQAIEWMIQVNPHKGTTNMEPYWKFKSESGFVNNLLSTEELKPKSTAHNSFQKQADIWQLAYAGISVQLKEVKGFFDLRKLIDNTGQPVHCAELMGTTVNTGKQPIIDEKARSEYQQRIRSLQQEIERADQNNDLATLSKLQHEYDQLLDHLSATLGLKGKIREAGNPVEKARSAVTWRIRNAISKIEKAHPSLGKHLAKAINTGTFCTYDPEKRVEWVLE